MQKTHFRKKCQLGPFDPTAFIYFTRVIVALAFLGFTTPQSQNKLFSP